MSEKLLQLPLNAIVPSPTNPRRSFDADALRELAASIKQTGLHQPVLVRPLPADRVPETDRSVTHELVSGERRWLASALAEQPTIVAMERDLSDEQVLEIQIIENLQRQDLTELEEAEGYAHLMDATGLNVPMLAVKLGKSESFIRLRLALLNLHHQVRAALVGGKLSYSLAALLAPLPGNEQLRAWRAVLQPDFYGDLPSVRQAKARLKQFLEREVSASDAADAEADEEAPEEPEEDVGGDESAPTVPDSDGLEEAQVEAPEPPPKARPPAKKRLPSDREVAAQMRERLLEAAWGAIRLKFPQTSADLGEFALFASMAVARLAEMTPVQDAQVVMALLEPGQRVSPASALVEWARCHTCPLAALALLVAATARDRFLSICDDLGVDRARLALEWREKHGHAAEALPDGDLPDGSVADAPAAQAKGGAGENKGRGRRGRGGDMKAPRLSAQEARRGIAAAMQSEEGQALLRTPASDALPTASLEPAFAPGQQVRVRATVRTRGKCSLRGKQVTVIRQEGSRWWVAVSFGPRELGMSETKLFDENELEALK